MAARLVVAAILVTCGRGVSSQQRQQQQQQQQQQGRTNNAKVQMREPRREKKPPPPVPVPVPPSEEDPGTRHKFIHDGTEYARPPNLFDVGGGELKLLPEVLSDLNFEARDFVDDGTAAEQKELRDSRPWGRLHVDGWPAPIQYLRSHFGGPPVEGVQSLVLAAPLDACKPLRNVDSAVVVAARGSCTYSTKAKHAQEASASSLLIVNNEQGIVHPPGPDGKGLSIFSGMVPQAEGEALIRVLADEPTQQGLLVPMNCQKNSGIGDKNQHCHPAAKSDRSLVQNLAMGGFVELPGGSRFEYLLAEFGVKVPSRELTLSSSHPSTIIADACTPPLEATSSGKAVLATRGECSFIDKAEAVGAGPGEAAAALIVVNNETSLFHMGAHPRWRGASVSFPTLLVSDVAGRALSALPQDTPIRFTPSKDVTLAAWDEIRRVSEASAWPKETQERRSMYETLVSENDRFPDRLSAVREAFSRLLLPAGVTGPREERGSGGGGQEAAEGVEL